MVRPISSKSFRRILIISWPKEGWLTSYVKEKRDKVTYTCHEVMIKKNFYLMVFIFEITLISILWLKIFDENLFPLITMKLVKTIQSIKQGCQHS